MSISASLRATLLTMLYAAKSDPEKIDDVITFVLNERDLLEEFAESLQNKMEKDATERRYKYYRLIRRSKDSGWLMTMGNADSNAKAWGRKNGYGDNESYYFVKEDFHDENLRTEDSATGCFGPLGVYDKQPAFSDQFILPDELKNFKPIR